MQLPCEGRERSGVNDDDDDSRELVRRPVESGRFDSVALVRNRDQRGGVSDRLN